MLSHSVSAPQAATLASLPTDALRAVALACAPSWTDLARLASTCRTLHAALLQSPDFVAEFLVRGVLADPSHVESAKANFSDAASGWQELPAWFDVIALLDFLRFDVAVDVLRIAQQSGWLPKLKPLQLLLTATVLGRKDVVDCLIESRSHSDSAFDDADGPLAFSIACAYGRHELLASLRTVAGEAFGEGAWELAASTGDIEMLRALESLGLKFETPAEEENMLEMHGILYMTLPPGVISRVGPTPGFLACLAALRTDAVAVFEFLVDRQIRAAALGPESLMSLAEIVSYARKPEFLRVLTRLAPDCINLSLEPSRGTAFILPIAAECGQADVCRAFLEKTDKEHKDEPGTDGDGNERDATAFVTKFDAASGISTSRFLSPHSRAMHVMELGPDGVYIKTYDMIIIRTDTSSDVKFEEMLRDVKESPVTALGFTPRPMVLESPESALPEHADGAAVLRAHGIPVEMDIYVADAEWAASGHLLLLSSPRYGLQDETAAEQRLSPAAVSQHACLAAGAFPPAIVYRTASVKSADARRRWGAMKRLLGGPFDRTFPFHFARPVLFVNDRNPAVQLDGLSFDAVRDLHKNFTGTTDAPVFLVVDDAALRDGRVAVGTVARAEVVRGSMYGEMSTRTGDGPSLQALMLNMVE
ncbi:hypothetical protein DFJ73DRAFT_781218 [Zopfochytrium polystomum]|nr:hypothetical protein DFJ73DRAFT_781218 [Zopfochytrium polystomum]